MMAGRIPYYYFGSTKVTEVRTAAFSDTSLHLPTAGGHSLCMFHNCHYLANLTCRISVCCVVPSLPLITKPYAVVSRNYSVYAQHCGKCHRVCILQHITRVFRRISKITESNYSFVRSASPYETARLPLDGFS